LERARTQAYCLRDECNELIKQSNEAIREGRWSDAEKIVRNNIRLWNELIDTEFFTDTTSPQRQFFTALAVILHSQDRGDEARFALEQALRIEDNSDLRAPLEMIALDTERGAWSDALAAYEALAAKSGDPAPWMLYEIAVLQMLADRKPDYRKTCQLILARLRDSKDPQWLEFGVHALVLGQDALGDSQTVIDWAARRLENMPTNWSQHVYAMALMRAGRERESLDYLDRHPPPSTGQIFDATWVLDHFLRALLHAKLGDFDGARSELEQAETRMREQLADRPGGFESGTPKDWHWRDGGLIRLLYREADSAVKAQTGEVPSAPLAP
jgi:tetratricopeptide (TPR) repeat protein